MKLKLNRYKELTAVGTAMGDYNYCAVIAVAVVLNCTYQDAYRLCENKGRKLGRGLCTYSILEILDEQGVNYTKVNKDEVLATVDRPNYRVKTLTTNNFKMADIYSKNTYLVFVNGHVAAVKNGVTHDWSENRAKKIKLIYQL